MVSSAPVLHTRARILEAARALAEDRGTNFRLEDVAQAARVSRQAVYLHFGSRSGLLLALVEHVDKSEGLPRYSQRVRSAPTGVDELLAFIDLIAEYTPRIYLIAKVLDEARRTDPAARAADENRMLLRREGCTRHIRRLHDEGRLAAGWTVQGAAETLWALTNVSTWEDLVLDRGWSRQAYARRLKRLCLATFVRPPAAG